MSGLRPSSTGVYENGRDWQSVIPPEECLPAQFRAGGYVALGAGKGYHGNPNGRNPGDVWTIPPDTLNVKGGDHSARFPEALVAMALLAGWPLKVCHPCGLPPLPTRHGR